MNDPKQDKDHQNEEPDNKREVSDKAKADNENKPSRLAERKGQRPAFPFKRKPL